MSAYLNAGMIDPYVMARAAEITAPLQPLCSPSAALCYPSAAAPIHTQFVNDSSYSRVYAALGAGARAQGRAHLPELQLKVGIA